MRKELFENFYSKIKFNENTWCWDWQQPLNSGGYGTFTYLNKVYRAHRISYFIFKGKIPDGYVVDHKCKNRSCVNPEHLEAVTISENLRNRNMNKMGYRIGKRLGNDAPVLDKLYIKIDIDNDTECWNYNRNLDKDGYGLFSFDGLTYRIHRFSYLLFQGEIPQNYVVDHICGNRKCCNPEHLRAVTQQENTKSGKTGLNNHQSKKNYCPKGHEYTPENTYLNPKGSRECRTCKTANRQADNEKNKDKYKQYFSDRYLKNRGELKGNANSRKTECSNGHKYTPENTSISKTGSRRCKQCNRDRQMACKIG